ncbi:MULTISPECIES: hypothetical protein [Brevibacillus]|uniref:hypothetical protein n=1 Tax=Brevibacillus TaxID=55080 RepID=UPI00024039B3|nr:MULTISPECIES: hypothetical protein [Brevibacillus]MBA4534099.1 hypothetical protein [Brevibacillus halotolerans]MCR8964441.1 hypothetical protein [Brevibacillus laterosporus]MCZ0836596.1 hypothetical protein [Brevibacillus halotolerans]PCN43776.1 hypothetical protein B9C88_13545 [Brevibacillus laterosporus]CCF14266.1 hypothetical protein BLGI_2192 [Brevibacillus laterosporus GI-9]
MTKRLSKHEYIVTYMIILSLTCLVVGFFWGANVVQSKMDEQLTQLQQLTHQTHNQEKLIREKKLYPEQDFTHYYYSFYEPLSTFQTDYFYYVANLQGKTLEEQKGVHSQLKQVVQTKIEQLEKVYISERSPLLVASRNQFLGSLHTLHNSLTKAMADTKGSHYSSEDIAALRHAEDFQSEYLQAQTKFYHAIAMWEQIYVLQHPIGDVDITSLTFAAWDTLPFHYRNYISARYMENIRSIPQFFPQDLTASIDARIKNKETVKLGWQNIPFGVNVLIASNGVHAGDFVQLNKKIYPALSLPEVPIYHK